MPKLGSYSLPFNSEIFSLLNCKADFGMRRMQIVIIFINSTLDNTKPWAAPPNRYIIMISINKLYFQEFVGFLAMLIIFNKTLKFYQPIEISQL